MVQTIHAGVTASVAELKENPLATVTAGEGGAVAILDHNQPAFYCVPAETWEAILERLEDAELNAVADARKQEVPIRVRLDDL